MVDGQFPAGNSRTSDLGLAADGADLEFHNGNVFSLATIALEQGGNECANHATPAGNGSTKSSIADAQKKIRKGALTAMARSEYTYTFIVRLWCERPEAKGATPEWRGSVESVPDGKRKYVTNLTQIADVIAAHLQTRRSRDVRE